MNSALVALVLVALAALLGLWRTWRSRTPYRALRVALQIVAAVLLALVLFPPSVDERFSAGTLVVLTPGITEAQLAALPGGLATVALPGADVPRGIERTPDLGTALRRHPDAATLRIVGGGLPPRDLDAARTLPVEFDAAPLGDGIVDLSVPASVRAGSTFAIAGRVHGNAGGRVELRDPAGAIVAETALADDGAFSLDVRAKAPGQAAYSLRVLDRAGNATEDLARPVAVLPGDALRVVVLAGAPDPELKYLRRWATDAGIELASRIVLSDGVAMQEGSAALDAGALANTDLVIVDERAWKGLDAATKTALEYATRNGLGLLLRVTGPLPDAVASEWQALGFRVRAADVPEAVSLASSQATSDPAAVLSRRALLVESADAAPLLRASDGTALALWRGDGRGRIAIWWLADSYRIALAGDASAFGTLWSRALSTIARARGAAMPEVPADARVNVRSVVCGLDDGAYVEQPDASRVDIVLDAADDGRRCAGYWPAEPGWHTLVSNGGRAPFDVLAANAAPPLDAARNADATRALAGAVRANASTATRRVPAPRWPFFVAWLLAAAALWWLERSKPDMTAR
jgi:hypothetical protein